MGSRDTAAQFAAIETSGSETLALASIRPGHGHAYLARLHTPLSLSVRPRMATACAFFPLGKCLRASAKPPPRKKGALLQQWIANGDPCKYVLRDDVATELGSPALAGGKICEKCYKAHPAPPAAGKENAPPDFLQPGALDVQRLRGGAPESRDSTRERRESTVARARRTTGVRPAAPGARRGKGFADCHKKQQQRRVREAAAQVEAILEPSGAGNAQRPASRDAVTRVIHELQQGAAAEIDGQQFNSMTHGMSRQQTRQVRKGLQAVGIKVESEQVCLQSRNERRLDRAPMRTRGACTRALGAAKAVAAQRRAQNRLQAGWPQGWGVCGWQGGRQAGAK